VREAYERQPDYVTDGENGKCFVVVTVDGRRFFAAANEVGDLTVMPPEEY
jgi:hypothetical protein